MHIHSYLQIIIIIFNGLFDKVILYCGFILAVKKITTFCFWFFLCVCSLNGVCIHSKCKSHNRYLNLQNLSLSAICLPSLMNVLTYATEVCMSCQPLLKLFLSSLRGVIPSFCLSSACCFSLDDKTCLSVLISSSSWAQKERQVLYLKHIVMLAYNLAVCVCVWFSVYFSQLLLDLLPLLLCHDGGVQVDLWHQIFISLPQWLRV